MTDRITGRADEALELGDISQQHSGDTQSVEGAIAGI